MISRAEYLSKQSGEQSCVRQRLERLEREPPLVGHQSLPGNFIATLDYQRVPAVAICYWQNARLWLKLGYPVRSHA